MVRNNVPFAILALILPLNPAFSNKITALRAEYRSYPDRFPFWNKTRHTAWDLQRTYLELWYGDRLNYVRLVPSVRSLAADILGFRADLPVYGVDLEIVGDNYCIIERKEFVLGEEEDDMEDCSEELAHLPIITADPILHFVKKPSYRSELHNLCLCKGSPYVVQLLGRTQDGELVFEKFPSDLFIFSLHNPRIVTIANVKQFLLHLIDAVVDIHSRGIIHRDLVLRNLLYSGDISKPVIIADVQSHWGSGVCAAPEVRDQKNFSAASDVYAISTCLMQFIFAINPRHPFVEYAIPAPFNTIYRACAQAEIHKRPTLAELKRMVDEI
jgi:serine/threonine protein kinase